MDQFTKKNNSDVDLNKSKYSIKIKVIGGKHRRTIIYGWYDNKQDLKKPFSILKKGCGGNIKKIEVDDEEEKVMCMLIQNHFDKKYLINFFKDYGINQEDIEFK